MYPFVKRFFDFTSALLLFIAISPLYLVIYILVAVKLGTPVYFKQERTGRNGKRFMLIKFRTMTEEKDENGNYLPDEIRLTKFGRFLRSTSLDELPELLNIIKNDMSVIGPRPLLTRYDEYYTEDEWQRFKVKGGLISPCNLNPNPVVTWEEQFEYDVKYAKNITFWMDIKILFSVFRILFKRSQNDYGSYVRKPLDVERREAMAVSQNNQSSSATEENVFS